MSPVMIHTQTHYTGQVFTEVRLEQVPLVSSEFSDCTFIRCSFGECVFDTCRLVNCVFQQCDLSLAQVRHSVFSATRFEDSQVIGVNWTLADWSSARLRDPVGFYRCAISHSTFIGLNLQGIRIRDCVAVDVDFREADLTRAVLAGTDLSESLFSNTNLTEADLSQARNYRIDPGQNVLTQAKFSFPEAISLLYSMDIVLTEGEDSLGV